MWLSIVGLLYAAQLAAANVCDDNCGRAIIASAFPTRSGVADCQSYLLTTVGTGPASTFTKAPLAGTPAYASACSSAAKYTSGCACVGVSPGTTYVPATIAGYPFLGCFVDTVAQRILNFNGAHTGDFFLGTPGNPMSNELCATLCSNFKYFGTEAGFACLCGDTLITAPTNTITAIAQCSSTCTGSPNEKCGAPSRIDVWGPNPTKP